VDYKVREEFSIFRAHEDLVDFANVANILESSCDDEIVNIDFCEAKENVCHGQEDSEEEFFYF